MGGTMAMYKTQAGKMVYDEDAPKKSVTDAMVKALSFIGFAGDIFSGIWDDWKYQEMAAAHYQNQSQPSNEQNQQQANNQQQKPLEQRYQDALVSIRNAKNPATLDKAINTFGNTKFNNQIRQACRARADQMSWSDTPPQQNQNPQPNSMHS
jgi:hypothetical protein